MDNIELKARQDLAAAYRLADYFGFSEGIDNHLSLSLPNQDDKYLLIPYGLHWSEVTASSLLVVNGEGEKISGEGYAEPTAFLIHGAVHRANNKNKCVMHTHMESALAITMLEKGRLLMADQNACRFYNNISYLDEYEGLVLNKHTAKPIGDSMIEADILFLANHGIIVTGNSVYEAWESLYYLEKACRAQILAMSTGKQIKSINGQIAKKVADQVKAEASGESANSFRHFEALKRLLVNSGHEEFLD
ncbi:MAG: Decarboxylase NovR [Alphaproteobacteria bacterium MarineAlpha9_Bin3]|nr:MAG: Decarboxylase NovR [Alphaproteobacteria bacterium MarineAlpha9_Bin3]|tara:strand:- start:1465 stop:2208 length:744 start_codon:yes stop_codon:yes gene_type:complete